MMNNLGTRALALYTTTLYSEDTGICAVTADKPLTTSAVLEIRYTAGICAVTADEAL
jgi:hypothetical protein